MICITSDGGERAFEGSKGRNGRNGEEPENVSVLHGLVVIARNFETHGPEIRKAGIENYCRAMRAHLQRDVFSRIGRTAFRDHAH